jgi:hypothetical protein
VQFFATLVVPLPEVVLVQENNVFGRFSAFAKWKDKCKCCTEPTRQSFPPERRIEVGWDAFNSYGSNRVRLNSRFICATAERQMQG